MQERVRAFITKRTSEERRIDDAYYYLVMKEADLLSDDREEIEVSKDYYNEYRYNYGEDRKENGKYYIKISKPLDVTDEEYDAILAAIPEEKHKELELEAAKMIKNSDEINDESSWAARFFTGLAILLWIGGLILAIGGANIGDGYRTRFDFATFMSIFVIYLISGSFALCAAELFKKLQTIVNLLKRK